MISAVHVPTSSGLVEPVAAIGALARRYGAITVLDATQSVGQLDIDVRAIGCDALVTTGRKFSAGRAGPGWSSSAAVCSTASGPGRPTCEARSGRASRSGRWTGRREPSRPGSRRWPSGSGLGEALREAHERGTAATEAHLVALGARLRTELSAIGGVTVADPPASPSGIVTFTVDGVPGRTVSARLREAAVDSLAVPASHAQWDLGARGLASVVRVSPHVYTDESDVEALLTAVAGVSS